MLETVLTYTVIELEVPGSNVSVRLSPRAVSYVINPLMPGTSYVVTVAYVNEVGESENNPRGKCWGGWVGGDVSEKGAW